MTRLLEQQGNAVEPLLRRSSLREIVFLCDGKEAIWTGAEKLEAHPMATLILDFYHATEHLSKAGEALFGKKSVPGRRWYHRHRDRLRDENGGATAAVRSMRYFLRKLGLRRSSERFETVRRVIAYFQRNLAKVDYAAFRARGLPIGSGPVEAACKSVVGARLKRSGMRWTRDGGQMVLNRRSRALQSMGCLLEHLHGGASRRLIATCRRTHTRSFNGTPGGRHRLRRVAKNRESALRAPPARR